MNVPRHLTRPQQPPQQDPPAAGPTERAGYRGCTTWPSLNDRGSQTQQGRIKETTKREDTVTRKGIRQGIKVEERQKEAGLMLAKGLRVFRRDKRQEAAPVRAAPRLPGPAHLARALCTGLIVQGEHLAVHHLPSLVVAVCRGRGNRGP